jgi:hypothetical protein
LDARVFVEVFSVADRVKVNWRVPSDEWDAFIDYVHDEHGEIRGYVGHEVERAMREWIDGDDFVEVEDLVDRLVKAAGRTPENLTQKKSSFGVDSPTGGDTTNVQCRVDPDIKKRFAHHAKTDTDDRVGTVLARSLRARRYGGRARRVKEKLNRVADDAEGLLAELNPDEDGLSLIERRTVAICNRLGPNFHRDDLEAAIEAVAGGSDPTVQGYTDRVLDRLEYVQHPDNPDLFIPEAEAERMGVNLDAPAFYRKGYRGLSLEEKFRGLQVELAQRSMSNDGQFAMKAAAIHQNIFDGQPSESHVRNLMDRAAKADGFSTDTKRGAERLRVNVRRIDEDVKAAVRAVHDDNGGDTPASGRGRHDGQQDRQNADEPDTTSRVQPDNTDDPGDVDAEMDALMNATPVTDGGSGR